jgi:peptidoglycan/xylan/chitin deacetylase (PgdA/CDA1 family)
VAESLPILTFHTLDDRRSVISFSPELFRRVLSRLQERGYRPLRLSEAAGYLHRGAVFPEKSLVLTFDDGYQTVYDVAFPVLQRYGMPATVFLTVGEDKPAFPDGCLPSLQGQPMLTWPQIREMQRWGMDFGAHTLTHPDLTRLPRQRAEAEILSSKSAIEHALGSTVECFAYPYGRYDRNSRDIVRQHYACACSDRLALVTAGSDPHALERVDMYYLRAAVLSSLLGTPLLPWYLRARAVPRRVRRAVRWRP